MKRMQNMKRILRALLITAVFAGAPGCSQKSEIKTGPVVLHFYEHSDDGSAAQAVAQAFNASQTELRVETHIIANDDYDDKARVLAAGSTGEMDVFWIRAPSMVQQYIANNVLADLTPFAAETGLDLAPIKNTSLPGASRDGKFYGMPVTGSAWLIFYNKDLFDAKGLPEPANLTWTEYLDLTKSLTYTEGDKKYWGGIIPHWSLCLGAAAGGEYLTAPEPLPRSRQYLEVLNRAYNIDKSSPGLGEMTLSSFDAYALFGQGTTYSMIMGDWSFSMLDVPFQYAGAPLPVLEGLPAESTVGQASYYCIPRTSKKQKEAWKFIEFATAKGGPQIWAEFKKVPSYPSEPALEVYQKLVTVPGVEYRFSARVSDESGTEPFYGDLNEAFVQEGSLYLLGEQSLDKAMDNFLKLRKEILRK
ncbi:MAG: extracellular solute-binding protein [Spirochaetaceae bacterium]|jgi:ABC-type glycerol-3-phosphate transport system substrate-binding protein|nr:extracellular solute-binding protein [Spirochaetaceae bacterium]